MNVEKAKNKLLESQRLLTSYSRKVFFSLGSLLKNIFFLLFHFCAFCGLGILLFIHDKKKKYKKKQFY